MIEEWKSDRSKDTKNIKINGTQIKLIIKGVNEQVRNN